MIRELYERSPVPVQNVIATAYGAREVRRRYTGSFRRFVAELEQSQWWDAERLEQDQSARLRRLVAHCAAHVPHYQDLFRDEGIDPADIRGAGDLAALPILDKETVRRAPERFMPVPRPRRLIHQTTGGTTGTPLAYVATPEAVQFNYATYEARARRWAGVKFGDRLASLQGQPIVPIDDREPPYWRRNLAFNQLYLSVYHLTDDALPAYVQALERFAPEAVVGYTSAVHRIARHILDAGDVGRVTPRAVLVSSETLLPAARADMEAAFGCRVSNGYSLGELVAFASDCPCGELHVSTEYGVVELVPTEGGTEVVATGLANLGMPLLRYRTGDLAAAAPDRPSACGRHLPVLADLTGRVDDAVRTPEGARIGPAPMSLAFQTVPNLRRAQVQQDEVERVRILLEVTPAYSDEDQALLERELRRRLGTSLVMDFERVPTVPRTSGGKERLVVSSLGRA